MLNFMKSILQYIISICFVYLMISCDTTSTIVRYEPYHGGVLYSLHPRHIYSCPPPPPVMERRVYIQNVPIQRGRTMYNNRGRFGGGR